MRWVGSKVSPSVRPETRPGGVSSAMRMTSLSGGVEGELGDGAAEGVFADVAGAVFGDVDLGEAAFAAGEGLDGILTM
jgi:hypothetical protein